MAKSGLYDALGADYDRFVNWPARLKHELPFFDRLFQEHGVRRVLDAACGTGQHAIALARQGYQVLGTDLSAVMVARAKENAAVAGLDLPFHVVGLGDLSGLGEVFDAAICLGNSLPHLLTEQAVAQALADFHAVLRPGGLLVIQNRNFDRVWVERERFMSPQSHRDGDEDWIFVRFYDYHEQTVTFHMLRLHRPPGGQVWEQEVEATELRPIFRDPLAAALGAAGFDRVSFFGGYDGSPFDPARSGDLIAVAHKAAND